MMSKYAQNCIVGQCRWTTHVYNFMKEGDHVITLPLYYRDSYEDDVWGFFDPTDDIGYDSHATIQDIDPGTVFLGRPTDIARKKNAEDAIEESMPGIWEYNNVTTISPDWPYISDYFFSSRKIA